MAIGSFLLATLCKTYGFYRQHDVVVQRSLREYDEAQWIKHQLVHSIRQAGFTPCLPLNSLQHDHVLDTYQLLPSGVTLNRMASSFQEVTILDKRHLEAPPAVFDASKEYLIADCAHVERVQIQSVQHLSGKLLLTLLHPIHNTYASPIYLGVLLRETYLMHANLMLNKDSLSHEVQAFEVQQAAGEGVLAVTLTMSSSKAYTFKARIRAL